ELRSGISRCERGRAGGDSLFEERICSLLEEARRGPKIRRLDKLHENHLARRGRLCQWRGDSQERVDHVGGDRCDDHRSLLLDGRSRGDGCDEQRRVLAENGSLELLQGRTRLDAEVLDQRRTCSLVGGERLRLAPGTVERKHQLTAQSLAE